MTAQRLDGRALAAARQEDLAGRVGRLRERGIVPRLSVILPGADGAARAYHAAKVRAAEKLRIEIETVVFRDPSTKEILSQVASWADDDGISGIMVEAPLPVGIDVDAVRRFLPRSKDVDGMGVASLASLVAGMPAFPPATAEAALILASSEVDLSGKHAVVIGRSLVVGRPLALLLLAHDATVTICHSKTHDVPALAREADILFVAIGRPEHVTAEFVKPGGVVIDIGTNVVAGGKLVGDVDAASVERVAAALSPVPGGVGPLTTTILLEHVVAAAEGTVG